MFLRKFSFVHLCVMLCVEVFMFLRKFSFVHLCVHVCVWCFYVPS